MIKRLRQYGGPLFFCIVCITFGFLLGKAVTKTTLMPRIAAAEHALSDAQYAFVQAQKKAADLNNQALRETVARQQALYAVNEQLTADLSAITHALVLAKQQHDRSIPDALNKDGKTYTGIGPDSLWVYTAALGYRTGPGDNRVSTATERHDTDPPQTPSANVRESSGIIGARQCLRGMEPDAGKQTDSYPALAGNHPGIE